MNFLLFLPPRQVKNFPSLSTFSFAAWWKEEMKFVSQSAINGRERKGSYTNTTNAIESRSLSLTHRLPPTHAEYSINIARCNIHNLLHYKLILLLRWNCCDDTENVFSLSSTPLACACDTSRRRLARYFIIFVLSSGHQWCVCSLLIMWMIKFLHSWKDR